MIYGVGTTDVKASKDKKVLKSYVVWCRMLSRCYNHKDISYENYGGKGVTVCEEWKRYSNFKAWFDKEYINGFQLDKDTKQKRVDKKIYSPTTCVFLSKDENVRQAVKNRENSYLFKKRPNVQKKGLESKKFLHKEKYAERSLTRSSFREVCKQKVGKLMIFTKLTPTLKLLKV